MFFLVFMALEVFFYFLSFSFLNTGILILFTTIFVKLGYLNFESFLDSFSFALQILEISLVCFYICFCFFKYESTFWALLALSVFSFMGMFCLFLFSVAQFGFCRSSFSSMWDSVLKERTLIGLVSWCLDALTPSKHARNPGFIFLFYLLFSN